MDNRRINKEFYGRETRKLHLLEVSLGRRDYFGNAVPSQNIPDALLVRMVYRR